MDLTSLLHAEFERRKANRPRYSLRSFARDLDLSPTTLSLIFNRKRKMAEKGLEKIAKILGLGERETQALIHSQTEAKYTEIPLEIFQKIHNWYHIAITSLADQKKNRAEAKWIASRLGIDVTVAAEALRDLVGVGMIEVRDGRMHSTNIHIETPTDVPSNWVRTYHEQNLTNAKKALTDVPVEQRDITSIVFSTSAKDLSAAKASIRRFRRRFCQRFESHDGEEVYMLAVQLFPQTKIINQEDQ